MRARDRDLGGIMAGAPAGGAGVPEAHVGSSAVLTEAREWLLRSGIREIAPNARRPAGGLHRSYDSATATYAPLYPEVTAYALQLHLRLWRMRRDPEDLEAARQSADWLLTAQGADEPVLGAFPYAVEGEVATGGWYTFDTAIIGHALAELGAELGIAAYATAAERAAWWVLEHQHPDGSFAAAEGDARPPSWAGDAGCLHAKHALLLGTMWKMTGESRYRDAMQKLLRWVVGLQRPDGAIPVRPRADYVMLHSHCYAIEGLLGGAMLLGDNSFLRAAGRAAGFLAHRQERFGGLPRYHGPGAAAYLREVGARLPRLRCRWAPSDVGATAQAVRIWSWMAHVPGCHPAPRDLALAWLARCQLHGPDPRLRGGFPAGLDRFLVLERRELRLDPWVAVLVADALRRGDSEAGALDVF